MPHGFCYWPFFFSPLLLLGGLCGTSTAPRESRHLSGVCVCVVVFVCLFFVCLFFFWGVLWVGHKNLCFAFLELKSMLKDDGFRVAFGHTSRCFCKGFFLEGRFISLVCVVCFWFLSTSQCQFSW